MKTNLNFNIPQYPSEWTILNVDFQDFQIDGEGHFIVYYGRVGQFFMGGGDAKNIYIAPLLS